MVHQGQVLDDGHVRMEFVRTSAETDGELHEMHVTYAPASPLPPAHLHPAQEERFEVAEGELLFVIDGQPRTVAAGESITVPPGRVHQVRNAGPVPAVATWQTRPALRTGEFFEAISAALADGDLEVVLGVVGEYAEVFRLADQPAD